MSNQTPKKGDVIFICGDWNGVAGINNMTEPGTIEAQVYVRKMRVESWGKKQAHFTDFVTGEKVGYRGYTERFEFAWTAEALNDKVDQLVKDKLQNMQRAFQIEIDWLNDYRNNPVSIKCGAVEKAITRIAAIKASPIRFTLIDRATRETLRLVLVVSHL